MGKVLLKEEVVHHKDRNPENNHWTNLEVTTQKYHATEHLNNGSIGRNEITGRFIKGENYE